MTTAAFDREFVKRHGLVGFVEKAWPVIEACDLIIEPHMPLVCKHYEAVSRGEIRDAVVAIPPGTSKSTTTSILWPAWDKIDNAWRKWLFTSYSEDLSLSFARRELDLITSEWFRERWPGLDVVGGGRAAAGDFWVRKNGKIAGRRFSTMMEGAATGVHAHILVCDDGHKPQEIKKGGEIAKKNLEGDWRSWTQTFSSRHADAATFARVVIAQRLHQEDISGRMLQSPRTVSIHLPMEFEPKHKMKTKWGEDWRTYAGELLAPKRFPPSVIVDKKHPITGMSASDYAAQFQQRPSPETGDLFQREWFERRWAALPPTLAEWTLSVDATFKENASSDFVVIQLWAKGRPDLYLVDQVRRRMSFTDTVREIERLRAMWPQVTQVVIEDRANGSAIIDTLKASMTGIVAANPLGGKFSRAYACSPLLRTKGVVFPSASWMDEFVEECANFPNASHDDQVDAMSQALLYLASLTSGGDFLQNMRSIKFSS